MMNSNKAFDIFNEGLIKRGYGKFIKKDRRKELGKLFVAEVKQCGIINVFKCSDYNMLCKLLGLDYIDEKGISHQGIFLVKEFKF